MMAVTRFTIGSSDGASSPPYGVILSLALHAIVFGLLVLFANRLSASEIVAAGPGEGGEGGGGAIEVGVADQRAILGFAKPQPVSYIGDKDTDINNARVENVHREEDHAEDTLPRTEKDAPDPKALKTDRPVVSQEEKIYTGKEERGRSDSSTAQVGRTYGTPSPAMIGGVGIGTGGGFGGGTGLPGGSEYGRRIQAIFSRNYNPSGGESEGIQTVIITLRISRDGKILSISNGRIQESAFKQRSALAQVNYAAERAVLASDPLPALPAGFKPEAGEVSVNLIFRYPK
ncbi:MAG TPA: TonB C-terminal domain-containing protein [Blastocatellia bacterium]|nr:TonB C-terminal domain-containing protein [Blastocatellia bacterium]